MNIFYYSGLDPSNPVGLRYDGGSLQYQGSATGLCSPASANPMRVSSTPVMAASPYGPPPLSAATGGRAMDLVVAPSTVLSLLAPQLQSTNFCAGAAYRMKTPYMIWPKLFRSRVDRVDKSVRCELCDMVLNSELQARQHFNGKHHLRKMRKLKLNSASAADEKSQTDSKRSSCKTESCEKKMRLKKRHGNRNNEDADKSITVDVPCNGTSAAEEEQAVSRDEEERSHQDKAEAEEHLLLRLEDRTMPMSFGILKDNDSQDNGLNPLDLGNKLTNVDCRIEELVPASAFSYSSHPSDNEFFNTCSSSFHANCALAQSLCQSVTCSNLSCPAPNDQCSLLHSSGMSTTPSASLCNSSLLLDEVLSQSSLQSFSHVMSSSADSSSSFKMATGLPMMTTSRGNDILSLSATPFVPGTILSPRP